MTTTINKEEIQKFSKLADEWWNVNGKFKPLHMFNPIRIEYITGKIKQYFKIKENKSNFLNGLSILDIGCGGGLISEPMARLGGVVTGIDASEKNIKVAKIHSQKNKLKIDYFNKSPEQLNSSKKFDIILNLEVVEHVDNVDLYIESCNKLLKKDGLMFTATLNRSLTSYLKAIIGAEYILRWLPIGTHDWNKFLKPEELEKILHNKKFSTLDIKGLEFNPILSKWRKSDNLSVNLYLHPLILFFPLE
jgi:2-polyprenyl-6-hydroxyphenyl methylase/3-demethylubiquinone-9 3-methyltransferase